MTALDALAEELRAEGGLVAGAVAAPQAGRAAGEGHSAEYALVIEAIREGYELHYGDGRVVRTEDRDLALLAGDRLYAFGLARLASLGDLEAVGILADLISLCAKAHAEQTPERAESAWEQATAALRGRGDAI
jgi:hypothetical protein